MTKETREKIDALIERGVSDVVLRELLEIAYEAEMIRFDTKGNPYWEGSGESLDPDIELEWED
jgi:hypothetical protein